MSQTVFILGAGASADSGAPLMDNFIDKAEDLFLDSTSNIDYQAFDNIFNLIGDLQNVYAKSFLNLDNIEVLFGAVEMASVIGLLGSKMTNQISQLRKDLITFIVQTIEKSIKFPVSKGGLYVAETNTYVGDREFVNDTETYGKFVNLIKSRYRDSAIITFNYDVALDFAYLNGFYMEPNYSLGSEPSNGIPLLKLHGSINWRLCSNGHIVPIRFIDFMESNKPKSSDPVNLEFSKASIGSVCPQCKSHLTSPIIVPPTWNKTEYHGALSNVWHRAAKELSDAQNIIVIGYSLPESDSFFRYLYALSTAGRSRIKHFLVFNPDKSDETQARYERLLGPGITKKRYKYEGCGFATAIDELEKT